MANITYLFGAGASANILPVVNQIPSRLSETINRIRKEIPFETLEKESAEKISINKSRGVLLEEILSDLEWLMLESSYHASVDTLAKKFFIRGQINELKRLKVALSIFFLLEQSGKKADYRYDAFYASILNRGIRSFPKNIKIVSWNYDYQFEISFAEYSGQNEITTNQTLLNIYQKNVSDENTPEEFGIYKINGSAGLYQPSFRNHFVYSDNISKGLSIEFLRSIIDNYANINYRNDIQSLLSFAWEDEGRSSNIIENTIKAVKETHVLVVIGYSFPFFNRDIDKRIINSMQQLNKVYIQAPKADGDSIKERFESISNHLNKLNPITKNDVYQFLLPFEL